MRTLLALVFSLTLFVVLAQAAHAQEKPFDSLTLAQDKQGITVAPSIIRLDLNKDAPQAEIYYKNNTHVPIELTFLAQDFSQEEETGRVRLLEPQDAKNYQYGLTSWISFEKSSITLSPAEGQSIKIFIDENKLTSGGHYASIQAQLDQKAQEGQVPVRAILSTLLFVRSATGNEHEEMSLQTVSPIRTLLGFPDTFLVRLQNSGNVELVPYGTIEIKDMFGNVVAKGIINEGSLITLPESVRRFDVPMKRQSRFITPGIYKANITVNFGKEDKTFGESVSFVSQGSINLLILGLIILAIVTALFVRKSFQAHSHQRR